MSRFQELQEALDEQKQTGKALVLALKRSSSGDSSLSERQLANRQTPYSSPVKILHQSRKHKRIVDQENVEVLFQFPSHSAELETVGRKKRKEATIQAIE